MRRAALIGYVLGLLAASLLFGQFVLPFRAVSKSTPTTLLATSTPTTMSPSQTLLGGGARWAGKNGSSALYIDWKDNWLNHHLTDGASWGPWPQEAEMDNWTTWVSQALTGNGFDVQLAGDIPDNLTGFDLVVLQAYWAIEPRHEPLIRQYIADGGGIVILQGVPELLRCYCKDWWTYLCPSDPVSALRGEWLGSTMYINTGGWARISVDNPFNTSLAIGEAVFLSLGYSNAAVSGLHADSHVVAMWDSGLVFAYTHEFGSGRIYYQATYSDETPSAPPPPPPPPLPPPPPPEETMTVRIQPENVTVKKDYVFTVSVTIENIPPYPGLAGIQFTVTWDSAILNALKVTDVVFHEVTPPAEYDNIWQLENIASQGYAKYAYLWLDSQRARDGGYLPISGNHTIATIELEAVGEGTTTLHISDFKAVSPDATPLIHQITAFSASVTNSVTVDSTVRVLDSAAADINRDGKIDVFDAFILSEHFGSKSGDSDWNARTDMNEDLLVDIYDALIFAQLFKMRQ